MGKQKNIKPGSADKKTGETADECRCKEAARKTPLELVKMALSDLGLKKKENKK